MVREYRPIKLNNIELKDKCGIYQIRNILNNKIYIGSADDLYARKRSLFYELNKNNHRNIHLQNSYNKYGKNNFVFEVIEFCNKDDKINIEQYWIDRFIKSDICCNIQPKAGQIIITEEVLNKMKGKTPWNKGKTGVYADETRLKMSINRKNIQGCNNPFYGKKHTEGTKRKIAIKNGVKILCIETEIIYDTIMDAERILGVNHSCIIRCCKNKQKTAGGYHWRYLDN